MADLNFSSLSLGKWRVTPFAQVRGVHCHGQRPTSIELYKHDIKKLLDRTPEEAMRWLAKAAEAMNDGD